MTAVGETRRILRVVELAGPAGVGKSTVTRELVRRFTAVPRTIWGQPALSLLGNGVQLGPTLLRFWRTSGLLLWDESRHIVRLRTLHRNLRGSTAADDQILVFDEGPVFALTWLRGFGHEIMRSRAADQWWRATLHQWSRTVDAVVVLDAPDTLLARRIRQRPEWHEVKGEPDWYIAAWMARFRLALDWVLAGLTVPGGPAVIRICTDQDEPEYLAQRVAYALDRIHDD
jgi:AAA domain